MSLARAERKKVLLMDEKVVNEFPLVPVFLPRNDAYTRGVVHGPLSTGPVAIVLFHRASVRTWLNGVFGNGIEPPVMNLNWQFGLEYEERKAVLSPETWKRVVERVEV